MNETAHRVALLMIYGWTAGAVVSTQTTHLALQAVDLLREAVSTLFGVLGIGARAHELRLFGFDLQDIAGMVFDELGVLILELGDLGCETHLVLPEVARLISHQVELGAQIR